MSIGDHGSCEVIDGTVGAFGHPIFLGCIRVSSFPFNTIFSQKGIEGI